jgi:hypothetical protein
MITICVFVLSSWQECTLFAGGTLAAWFLLCDYFMLSRVPWWTQWMDHLAFIPAVFLGAVLMIAWEKRIILAGTAAGGASLPVVLPGDRFEPVVWRRMFGLVAETSRSALTRRFLRWTNRRITKLDPKVALSYGEIFAKIHKWPGGRMRLWAAFLWLPAVWISLITIPLQTNVMEHVAAYVSGRPAHIFDLIAIANDVLPESLVVSEKDGSLGRVRTASFLGGGTLKIRATDFPRVYRRVEAVCGGQPLYCGVAENRESNSELDLVVPLRGGSGRLSFVQKIAGEPRLNMKLYLTRRDGVVLDTVSIEPVP